METKMKKIKITTIILAIALVTLVAFGGVYIKTQNRMENKVKEYSYGRELDCGRIVELVVHKEENEEIIPEEGIEVDETESSEEINTEITDVVDGVIEEKYEIAKKTIEKRLNNLGAQDYTISLNKEDGTIRVELEENNNTDTYVYYLVANGKVQIVEKDEKIELLSDSMVKKATYTYTANAEGEYQVLMELNLTEEGQTKIEEIKNTYAVLANEIKEIEDAQSAKENTEENAEETVDIEDSDIQENEEIINEVKKIAKLTIGGNEYDIEKIEKNKITVLVGSKTKNMTNVNNYISLAAEATMLINSGKYPIEYEVADNRVVYTDISEKQLLYFVIAIIVLLVVVCIVVIVKYKTNGIFVSVSYIGFVSLLSLILRYANVIISIEGIGAIIVVLIFNIRINQIILEKLKVNNNNIGEVIINTYKDIILKSVPLLIIVLVFCFVASSNLNSFGMIMFWGVILSVVYNLVVTKTLLKLKESK